MAETKEQLLEENEALRARIQELERELKRDPSRPRILDKETSDRLRDLPNEVIEQTSRFLRALSLAVIESGRISGEALTAFADEVVGRNAPSEGKGPRDLAMNLSRDMTAAGVNALERSIRMHGRVVDRFSDAFKEGTMSKGSTKT